MGLGGTRGRGRVGDGASGATRTRVRMQRKGSECRGEADLQAQNLGRGKGGRKWFKETSLSSLAAPRAGCRLKHVLEAAQKPLQPAIPEP